jgi:hypothetical protein
MPLTAVQDDAHREFSKYKIIISYQTVVTVLGKVVELVEANSRKSWKVSLQLN